MSRFLLHCSSVLHFFCVYQALPNHVHACVCAWHVCVACVCVLTEVCFRLRFVCLFVMGCVLQFGETAHKRVHYCYYFYYYYHYYYYYHLPSIAVHSFSQSMLYTHSSNLSDTCKALISSTDTLAADNN